VSRICNRIGYFQGVKFLSGLFCLAFLFPMTIFDLVAGILTTVFGVYVPLMWAGSVKYVVGSVLLHLLAAESNAGQYIGYQVLSGIGCGMAIQTTFFAVQAFVSPSDMAQARNMEVFFRRLGSSIAISLAENVFLSTMRGCSSDGIHTGWQVDYRDWYSNICGSYQTPSADQLHVLRAFLTTVLSGVPHFSCSCCRSCQC